MRYVFLGGVLTALVASPAFADDPTSYSEGAKDKYSNKGSAAWTNCHAGVIGGGSIGRSNQVSGGPAEPAGAYLTAGYGVSGPQLGATAGCDLQPGIPEYLNLVFGFEGDFSGVFASGAGYEPSQFTPGPYLGTKEKWLATGRVTIGYAVNYPNPATAKHSILLYATGGIAAASDTATWFQPYVGSFADTRPRFGYTVGAGIKVKINDDWHFKTEYLFVQQSPQSYFPTPPNPGISIRTNVPMEESVFRIGVERAWSPS